MDAPRVLYKTGFQYWGESSSQIIRTCRVHPKHIMLRHIKRPGSRWVAISTWKTAVLVLSPTSEKEKKQQQTKNAKPNQNPQQNKNQTTTPKTVNKGTVANAALLITSLLVDLKDSSRMHAVFLHPGHQSICSFTGKISMEKWWWFCAEYCHVLMFFL